MKIKKKFPVARIAIGIAMSAPNTQITADQTSKNQLKATMLRAIFNKRSSQLCTLG
jgi:ABC-type phosphate transport system substrate-binding protein